MLITIAIAVTVFAAQVAVYALVTRSRRAHYRARLATLVVNQKPARIIASHAHNRPGDN